jgi:hypothetical protein
MHAAAHWLSNCMVAELAVAGGKMAAGLFEYLEHARTAGSMPDVLVTDNFTLVSGPCQIL